MASFFESLSDTTEEAYFAEAKPMPPRNDTKKSSSGNFVPPEARGYDTNVKAPAKASCLHPNWEQWRARRTAAVIRTQSIARVTHAPFIAMLADTSAMAIDAALNGSEYSDCGVSTIEHQCTCIQRDGTPCHVGLYGPEPAKAR
jgi:hypothetical protein